MLFPEIPMTSVVLGRLTSGDAPVADRVKSLEKDPELVPWTEKNLRGFWDVPLDVNNGG